MKVHIQREGVTHDQLFQVVDLYKQGKLPISPEGRKALLERARVPEVRAAIEKPGATYAEVRQVCEQFMQGTLPIGPETRKALLDQTSDPWMRAVIGTTGITYGDIQFYSEHMKKVGLATNRGLPTKKNADPASKLQESFARRQARSIFWKGSSETIQATAVVAHSTNAVVMCSLAFWPLRVPLLVECAKAAKDAMDVWSDWLKNHPISRDEAGRSKKTIDSGG